MLKVCTVSNDSIAPTPPAAPRPRPPGGLAPRLHATWPRGRGGRRQRAQQAPGAGGVPRRKDLEAGINKDLIALRLHISLVAYILDTAQKNKLRHLAFSGGVFQNSLLIDLIIKYLQPDYNLYFHKEFSPNDEGIPFGQLMYYSCL